MRKINELRASMEARGLDALLIEKRENYFYLTGMTGEDSFCVVTQADVFLIVDFRFTTQATAEAPDCNVMEYSGDVLTTFQVLFHDKKLARIGYDADNTTCARFADLTQKVFNVTFLDATGLVETLRMCKEESEIKLINRAVEIADAAFQSVLPFIRPGVTELDVAAELEYRMRKLGATGPSFKTIVASGARGALPHGMASDKRIKFGDAVTIDFGAYVQGYCSDMTRTIFVGKAKPQFEKLYAIVLEAQQAALHGCIAGATGRQVDAIARGIITQAGYGANFGHGTGHGLGCEIHEHPRINARNETPLEEGMVVTIEPGIYLPGVGGIRIEDVVIVHGQKPLVLTQTSKELFVV